jgi:hypothetical protein
MRCDRVRLNHHALHADPLPTALAPAFHSLEANPQLEQSTKLTAAADRRRRADAVQRGERST